MKCFYHKTDLDGHCSGAIVKMRHPECEMIGVDYADNMIDLTKKYTFMTGEVIFVVDFSFPRSDMEGLSINNDLHWIDHHKSAIEKMEGFECQGIQENGKSGCELTWDYLNPEVEMPLAVKLLGRYDVWDHRDNLVLPFQYGFRTFEETLPDSPVWSMFLKLDSPGTMDDIHDVIKTGNIIMNYEFKQNEMYAKGMSFEVEFEGFRAIAINKAFSNSKIFDSVYDPDKHDIMIIFGYKPGTIKYTLFAKKPEIDVSEIAKKYGGGGHKGAAGFFSEKMMLY